MTRIKTRTWEGLTSHEAAKMLGIPGETVRWAIRSGKVEVLKRFGRRQSPEITLESLREYVVKSTRLRRRLFNCATCGMKRAIGDIYCGQCAKPGDPLRRAPVETQLLPVSEDPKAIRSALRALRLAGGKSPSALARANSLHDDWLRTLETRADALMWSTLITYLGIIGYTADLVVYQGDQQLVKLWMGAEGAARKVPQTLFSIRKKLDIPMTAAGRAIGKSKSWINHYESAGDTSISRAARYLPAIGCRAEIVIRRIPR